jgi:uncharacterized protein YdhG (YjbR/CyaY superfamily)
MVQSAAATVADYLDALPPERRAVIAEVRKVIRRNLPKGYQEVMNWGAITYELPLERYPNTYNGQPLCYAALAAQKNHFALYLMSVYGDKKLEQELRDAFRKAGKKLDMGKSCVRFKSVDQLPLDAIGRIIAAVPPEKYIAIYAKSRGR